MAGNFLDASLNSFTQITTSFVQPAVSSTVTVTVGSASWIPLLLGIFIEVGGSYQITAIVSATRITIKNLGGPDNADPGDTVPAGSRLSSAGSVGEPGPTGPVGATGAQGATGATGATGAAASNPVTSVFSRIGTVVANVGDYTSNLITNVSTVAGSTVSAAFDTLKAAIAVQYASTRSTGGSTLQLADAKRLVRLTGVGTITVPTNATVAFAQFAEVNVLTETTGAATFTPAGGVTIHVPKTYDNTTQWALYRLIYLGSDEWLLLQIANRPVIINTDVSASAAIAGSKIAPDFGAQTVKAGAFGDGTTGVVINGSSAGGVDIDLQVGGTPKLQVDNGNFISYVANHYFAQGGTGGALLTMAPSGASGTLDAMTVQARNGGGSGTYKGGDLALAGGNGNTGSGSGGDAYVKGGDGAVNHGNVALGAISTNFQGMARGVFIANSTAIPTNNPTGGGFFYVESGALKYRGSSGTVTTLGPA